MGAEDGKDRWKGEAKEEENGETCGWKVGERAEEEKEVCGEIYEEDNMRSALLI